MAKFIYELDRLDRNYELQVARGRIEGAVPFAAFGWRSTIGPYSGILWPGTNFAFPLATGSNISVVSTSANDTAAGTGARVVRVLYLDVNLVEHYEDITLNGLTPVTSTASDIRYVNGGFCPQLGSGKAAAGDITIYSGTGNHSVIAAGDIRCTCSVRTVPAGKRLMINAAFAGSISGTAAAKSETQVASTLFNGVDYTSQAVFVPYRAGVWQDGSGGLTLSCPTAFYEGTSLCTLATCDKAATIVGSYQGWLEPV